MNRPLESLTERKYSNGEGAQVISGPICLPAPEHAVLLGRVTRLVFKPDKVLDRLHGSPEPVSLVPLVSSADPVIESIVINEYLGEGLLLLGAMDLHQPGAPM